MNFSINRRQYLLGSHYGRQTN